MDRIAPAKNTNRVVVKRGTTDDIIKTILECYSLNYSQVKPLCKNIAGDYLQKCKLIFDLVDQNITYQLDPIGKQNIKTPARLWQDKTGDCKAYAIFICSCLRCLDIPHVFRFTSYTSRPEPTHVYAVAFDETGREIIVDPVFKINGVAQFNRECKYNFKKDMSGTTEISYLAGIGYPGEGESNVIRFSGNKVRTRREQDLLFNLNLLNMMYSIESKYGKNPAELQFLFQKMSICSSCLNCFDIADQGLITDADHGLTYVLYLVKNGKFNLPEGATLAEHTQNLQEIYGAIVQNANNINVDETAFFTLYNLTGATVVDNIVAEVENGVSPTFGGIGDINSGYDQWAKDYASIIYTDPTKGQFVVEAVRILKDSAAYFMYTFIPDNELSEYKEIVQKKRSEYFKLLNRFQDNKLLTQAQCEAVIFLSIRDKWGLTPTDFLTYVKAGEIPMVGFALSTVVTVVGLLVAILSAVAPIIASLKKDQDEIVEGISVNAPTLSDGVFPEYNTDYSGSGGTTIVPDNNNSGFTTASDNLIPMLLIGGTLIVMVKKSGKKSKKKKKK